MKTATAVLVGLITFSYAGVASAWSCAPSAPKSHNVHSSYVIQPSAIAMMLIAMRGY